MRYAAVAVLIVLSLVRTVAAQVHEATLEGTDLDVESVNGALKRARAGLRRRLPSMGDCEPPPAPDSRAERALLAEFVRAWESGDVEALVALLTADVSVSMPPVRFGQFARTASATV